MMFSPADARIAQQAPGWCPVLCLRGWKVQDLYGLVGRGEIAPRTEMAQ